MTEPTCTVCGRTQNELNQQTGSGLLVQAKTMEEGYPVKDFCHNCIKKQ